MPKMSALEASFCRSAPWGLVARRMIPWATQGFPLTGDLLEIGGGSGAMAEAVARAHPRVRLTTTDADPAMVQAGQDRLAGFALAQARQADARRLPFQDESFDTVLSFLMLHHVMNRPGFNGDIVNPEGWAAWSHHGSTPTSYASEPQGWRSMRDRTRPLEPARSVGSGNNSVSTPK
ncbi:class I SAM-dependent methyltransferase, partial [Kocuria atrinae]